MMPRSPATLASRNVGLPPRAASSEQESRLGFCDVCVAMPACVKPALRIRLGLPQSLVSKNEAGQPRLDLIEVHAISASQPPPGHRTGSTGSGAGRLDRTGLRRAQNRRPGHGLSRTAR